VRKSRKMGITIAAMSTRIAAIAARSIITTSVSSDQLQREHFHSKFLTCTWIKSQSDHTCRSVTHAPIVQHK
jgi:hypothetical protein